MTTMTVTLKTRKTARAPRSDNRFSILRDAAARLIARQGYVATSMRDIASEANILPGSVYYHFSSKEEMLLAVYETGVKDLEKAAIKAVGRESEPWLRLEALCRAHLETILRESDYAQVLIRVIPDDVPNIADRLRALRESYERIFRDVVAELPLPAETDRRALRLMLIGALNWAALWFDPQGSDSPRALARKFVGFIKKETQDGRTST